MKRAISVLTLLTTIVLYVTKQHSQAAGITVSDLKHSIVVSGAQLRNVGTYLQKSTSSYNLEDNIELLQEALEEGSDEEVEKLTNEGKSEEFVEIAKRLISIGESQDEQVICTPDNMEFLRQVADEPTPGLRISIVVQKLLLKVRSCPDLKEETWPQELGADLEKQFQRPYYNDLMELKLFRELQSSQTAQRGLEGNFVFQSVIGNKIHSAEYTRGGNKLKLENLSEYLEAWERDFLEPCRRIVSHAQLRQFALPIANLEIAAAKFNAWEADEFESRHYLGGWANRFMTCDVLLKLNQEKFINDSYMRKFDRIEDHI